MPFTHKVEIKTSGSVADTAWLDVHGAANWQLVQVVPLSPIQGDGTGGAAFYFISGSF